MAQCPTGNQTSLKRYHKEHPCQESKGENSLQLPWWLTLFGGSAIVFFGDVIHGTMIIGHRLTRK
jgi:hypothetical protein